MKKWGVGCAYLVFKLGKIAPMVLVSRVNTLDNSQIGLPEHIGRVDEQKKLVLQHVPCMPC